MEWVIKAKEGQNKAESPDPLKLERPAQLTDSNFLCYR